MAVKREALVHLIGAHYADRYDRAKYDLKFDAGGLHIIQKSDQGSSFPDPWRIFLPWHRVHSVVERYGEPNV
jgi:hypothetical protein